MRLLKEFNPGFHCHHIKNKLLDRNKSNVLSDIYQEHINWTCVYGVLEQIISATDRTYCKCCNVIVRARSERSSVHTHGPAHTSDQISNILQRPRKLPYIIVTSYTSHTISMYSMFSHYIIYASITIALVPDYYQSSDNMFCAFHADF